MYNLSKNAGALAKGIFYLLIGIILGLSAFNILDGEFMRYIMLAVAAYFIVYGFFLSGFYDMIMRLVSSKS